MTVVELNVTCPLASKWRTSISAGPAGTPLRLSVAAQLTSAVLAAPALTQRPPAMRTCTWPTGATSITSVAVAVVVPEVTVRIAVRSPGVAYVCSTVPAFGDV